MEKSISETQEQSVNILLHTTFLICETDNNLKMSTVKKISIIITKSENQFLAAIPVTFANTRLIAAKTVSGFCDASTAVCIPFLL